MQGLSTITKYAAEIARTKSIKIIEYILILIKVREEKENSRRGLPNKLIIG
jgi:hypothetical protein